ncbi:MAG TPA: phosphate acyltransferase PlsX [Candidatus Binataceae bacterium]|nr:phosphate acyltransferase PlsX [Candidatus Binataceae bacterium]
MKIAVDVMGGDLAPKAAVEGAVRAAADFAIETILVGDRAAIEAELKQLDTANLPLTIEHAAEVVKMDDSPLESVLTKPESSIHVGLELVHKGAADAFVSAGNSGAVMAAAMAILGSLPGIDRPAIASTVPTTTGLSLLIDAGANTDVKAINLMQFGVMGSVYWKHVAKMPAPRVAILSNGEEESKGTDNTRHAAAMLKKLAPTINYVGYVEGRDINRARADVVVTDGFTGNVALKTMEGFAAFLIGSLREVFEGSLLRKFAFLLIRKKLRALRTRLDPSEYGGAPLLGVNGVTMIAHGSSSAHAIRNAIRAAADEALVRNVNAEIIEVLAQAVPDQAAAQPAPNKGLRGLFLKMRERLHHRTGSIRDKRPEHPADSERDGATHSSLPAQAPGVAREGDALAPNDGVAAPAVSGANGVADNALPAVEGAHESSEQSTKHHS